jgi:hypothetical protein
MTGLADAVGDVLAAFAGRSLNGHALRVTDDSNVVNPPAVWVPMPTLTFQFSKRCMEAEWSAFLVAPNTSTVSVSATLSALLDAVLGLYPFIDATPQPLTLPGGGLPVPAYHLTWSSRIPIGA